MRVTLPAGAYLIVEDSEGRASKTSIKGCEGVVGVKAAALMDDGSVTYAPVTACEEREALMREVRGKAFSTLVAGERGLAQVGEGSVATPAPTSLGRVRRFEHQHLGHILGFALSRSGGDVESVWGEYPGDALRHAPLALLKKVGGVEEVLWGVALGGQADVEEFVSGLALGMGGGEARIRLGRGALQALTLALRRGGVRHVVSEGVVVIGSVMDVLVPYREPGGRWVEPVEFGGDVTHAAVTVEIGSQYPLIVGYLGWYLAK